MPFVVVLWGRKERRSPFPRRNVSFSEMNGRRGVLFLIQLNRLSFLSLPTIIFTLALILTFTFEGRTLYKQRAWIRRKQLPEGSYNGLRWTAKLNSDGRSTRVNRVRLEFPYKMRRRRSKNGTTPLRRTITVELIHSQQLKLMAIMALMSAYKAHFQKSRGRARLAHESKLVEIRSYSSEWLEPLNTKSEEMSCC